MTCQHMYFHVLVCQECSSGQIMKFMNLIEDPFKYTRHSYQSSIITTVDTIAVEDRKTTKIVKFTR